MKKFSEVMNRYLTYFFPIRDYIVIVASTATYVVVTLESIERPLNAKHLGDHRDTRQQVL